ncbi:uncharacterized protein LOC106667468 [Cimex lectularius]|uniref:Uncharacterized protein n=1 Tax=Cimex lectularius TaxID=79782 RepID=A0A8I6SIE5_CIMLE|nr:uncharacterized protein LOC106667468 [Cimex lectularius]XP_024082133.1 uncharacterized protein LOC106667468 [Cimex lectularius]XP_024082134.1 uncharacterized protein LOC106667468 [Cimex lectularius]
MSSQGGVSSNQQKRPIVVVYPTVAPETIVIPIVSCILGFPLLALLVICCLRRRAKLARERDRRRAGNCETETGAISLARFSPMHKLGVYLAGPSATSGRPRAVSLRSERALSRGFPSLELDTVVEERSEPDSSCQIEQSSS